MGRRVSYPVEVKLKAIEMRLAVSTNQRSYGNFTDPQLYTAQNMDEVA